ncbi:hypothetical protein M2298_001474 [Brevibacillus sp. 1238]|nr:hypothetical protein [Brevibacillus sp. 1238]
MKKVVAMIFTAVMIMSICGSALAYQGTGYLPLLR